MSENRSQTFFVGALITSAVGAILLLATNFAGFDGSNYYLGVYLWGGIGAFGGAYDAAIAAFILIIIGGIIFAVVATDEEWWWWFDAGFYGGIIGGLLTVVFYYMGEKEVVL